MDHGITRLGQCKICLHFLAGLRKRATRFGERVFAAPDALARDRGWQVIIERAGLSRRYRDPRFDTVAAYSRRQDVRVGSARGS
ncbi:MAG TPA: hypothetical protein VEM58_05445 [Streptosporangiaceae bacterium]|nr:hypothetical protein [Streptosporangiaceae bacterium]